jgi:AmmeMemoRadiSam system protein B/AmmeMemoRadiSam system protein A
MINNHQRSAAVAGSFYPGRKSELVMAVDKMLARAVEKDAKSGRASPVTVPKALIVPHAGYQYCGEIAASAYATILAARNRISRVVLLGPAHRVLVQGVAMSSADYFLTPLGQIPLDTALIRQCVSRFPFVSINDESHREEHSLETQLPFIQRGLEQFSLVPFVVGNATPEQVAQCLAFLWGNEETLILVSSDLSHFLPYDEARQIDLFTSRAIVNLNPDPIGSHHACGQTGIRALLQIAQKKKLEGRQLDLGNSGDTAGPRDQVVGYGGFGFYPDCNRFNDQQRSELTRIAWSAIDHGLNYGRQLILSLDGYGSLFIEPAASFITFTTAEGKLRGCMGNLSGSEPLLHSISNNAFNAGFTDPRFDPLTIEERVQTHLEISVLSQWTRLEGDSEEEILAGVRPFIDGLILIENHRRGTFLPSVWKSISDPEEFLRQLKGKAGLDGDYWSDAIEVYRYTTESWQDIEPES